MVRSNHERPATHTRGSSGATITRDTVRRTIIKAGDKRVGVQGSWIRQHKCNSLPLVGETWPTGYIMEMLNDLPRGIVAPNLLLAEMLRTLYRDIWSRKPEVVMDWDKHIEKVNGLANDAERLLLDKARDQIDWTHVTLCLTHGDPTYDNVMLRPDGSIVLIDPLPATQAVPSMMAVDLGKVLQSVTGYEYLRYGDSSFSGARREVLAEYFNDNEMMAAHYWCAVHYLRAIPYMQDGTTRDAMRMVVTDVLRSV